MSLVAALLFSMGTVEPVQLLSVSPGLTLSSLQASVRTGDWREGDLRPCAIPTIRETAAVEERDSADLRLRRAAAGHPRRGPPA